MNMECPYRILIHRKSRHSPLHRYKAGSSESRPRMRDRMTHLGCSCLLESARVQQVFDDSKKNRDWTMTLTTDPFLRKCDVLAYLTVSYIMYLKNLEA